MAAFLMQLNVFSNIDKILTSAELKSENYAKNWVYTMLLRHDISTV